jgi:hypothetical protein
VQHHIEDEILSVKCIDVSILCDLSSSRPHSTYCCQVLDNLMSKGLHITVISHLCRPCPPVSTGPGLHWNVAPGEPHWRADCSLLWHAGPERCSAFNCRALAPETDRQPVITGEAIWAFKQGPRGRDEMKTRKRYGSTDRLQEYRCKSRGIPRSIQNTCNEWYKGDIPVSEASNLCGIRVSGAMWTACTTNRLER